MTTKQLMAAFNVAVTEEKHALAKLGQYVRTGNFDAGGYMDARSLLRKAQQKTNSILNQIEDIERGNDNAVDPMGDPTT